MKSFLQELAEKFVKGKPALEDLTFVFPNRRAVIYFRNHLSLLLTKPAFSPKLYTIEDLVAGFSNYRVPDRLELIHLLYKIYQKVRQGGKEAKPEAESFDNFYFWGDMLLRDFDELDKYMINVRQLFKDLSNQKELDASFDFLTPDQQEFLLQFWGKFDGSAALNRRRFLNVWSILPEVYETFRTELHAKGIAYEGMLHRAVADALTIEMLKEYKPHSVVFAGFNALTAAEETIINFLASHNLAEVHWDVDSYYVNDNQQEAGEFFRAYQRRTDLGKTFPADLPSNFLSKKKVQLIGASQHIGQTKALGQILRENKFDPKETLVVLPDEKLLLPVLHGISGSVDKLNVTMGFPLSNSPVFNLVEMLVELQQYAREGFFNHRQALSVLAHPYIVSADPGHASRQRKEVLEENRVSIPQEFLQTGPILHGLIFRQITDLDIMGYLRAIIQEIGGIESLTPLDKEFVFHALTLINRLEEILGADGQDNNPDSIASALKGFLRLFKQLARNQRIPFTGEPLAGLQVMGVLETRNLDFKNVMILSMNEGSLPASGRKSSYIPHNIRLAYGLPTAQHQDSIYAYLFYRVLQRAENVFLFYNTEPDVLGQGEMSRFLQQIIHESGWDIEHKVLHNPVSPHKVLPIEIKKTEKVLQSMARLNEGTRTFKGISPSALNTYLECQLQFYLKHIARIYEPKEVEEYLDVRVVGILLHEVMEKFYQGIQEKKKSSLIQATDFIHAEAVVDKLIEEVFRKKYSIDNKSKMTFEGQGLVVKEIIRSFASRIIALDKEYAPFTIEGLERAEWLYYVKIAHAPGQAVLSGKIDRLDRKGDVVRVLDYKTGKKDSSEFKDIESLFDRNGKRNKAAFQTMIYAMLYKTNNPTTGVKLRPGLITRATLFDDQGSGLILDKIPVDDAHTIMGQFEEKLQLLLEELYNPEETFKQTQNTEICRYCNFKNICYR